MRVNRVKSKSPSPRRTTVSWLVQTPVYTVYTPYAAHVPGRFAIFCCTWTPPSPSRPSISPRRRLISPTRARVRPGRVLLLYVYSHNERYLNP